MANEIFDRKEVYVGRDFGAAGKPGHRFFFRPEEVEPLDEREGPS